MGERVCKDYEDGYTEPICAHLGRECHLLFGGGVGALGRLIGVKLA